MNRRITVLQTGALPLGYVTIPLVYGLFSFLLKNNIPGIEDVALTGADYGARTRHLNLGKVALYQMS